MGVVIDLAADNHNRANPSGVSGTDNINNQVASLGEIGGDIQDSAYRDYLAVLNGTFTQADGTSAPATPAQIAAATAKYGIETQRAIQILKAVGKSEDFIKAVVQALQ